MRPTAFAPSAGADFEAAAGWYESHADGLGERFVTCVDEMVIRISAAPREFSVWERDRRFRRAVVRERGTLAE